MSRIEEESEWLNYTENKEIPLVDRLTSLIVSFVLENLPDRRFLKRRATPSNQSIIIGTESWVLNIENVKLQGNTSVAISLHRETGNEAYGVLTDPDFAQIFGASFALEGIQTLLAVRPLSFTETMRNAKEGRIDDLSQSFRGTSVSLQGKPAKPSEV